MTQHDVATERGVDLAWVEEFGERWLEAWNSREPDVVLALMTPDIEYDDSAWARTMRGHADVREFLDYTWRAFPDLRFELVEGPFLHPSEPKVAFSWRATATNTGPIDPPGLNPTGKPVRFEGADFHEYRDGKVARLNIVFDMADPMRQLGGLPARGSRQERMLARLGNLRGRLPGR
jgi:steroid delta-isomerase-like uncharacterized protein